ncbi:hypothetical protein cce_0531 [Crocosphaera subtropica ATCC 51142]|uniref:Uncharacterized protein n=1 Tax=Crocosphaera subtropica (strain ATCC 51142 / BH68) TaxID=43989 RepID=B1WPA0_CROS5|nr:hypothetical protein [Crocosphaera subtropica]ACB49882.1 hypothetical protein cce_0531 [Crocosphaera subtropica ATCC 51142]
MVEKSQQKQKLLQELVGKDQGKNQINLLPKKIADPINKNLQNRYQGLIEQEELDGLNVWESNEIIKQLDAEKPISKIDVDRMVVDNPTQKIIGILPSNNLNLSAESPSLGSIIVSPIPVALLTLVSGVILLQKKDTIAQFFFDKDGIVEQIMEKLGLAKPKVSETAIFLHNRTLENAKLLAKSAQAVDKNKFSKHEFLLFAKIKFCLQYNQGEYEGLDHSIQLFKSAVKAQKSYVIISQIESMCQGIKQKEFYDYVNRKLQKFDDSETFNEQINEKLTEILPKIKTEEGKNKLQTYAEEIAHLSEDICSLQLFSWFNQQQLTEFSVLKSIIEIIESLDETDVINLKALTCLVMVHYDNFEALGQMIGVTGKKSSPDTYARMIQYIALEERHKKSYGQFEQLINVMRQWYPLYQGIKGIRDEYPEKDYRKPKDFLQEIPGIELYHKYRNYLTDQKTGHIYIDFGEETESEIEDN